MKTATDIRVGNVLRIDGKICKVMHQEIRGTGKFGKTVHIKVKSLEDGHSLERGIRAEDSVEELDLHRVKMQYSYRDGDQFIFMNTETFEQFSLPAKTVGRHEVFLKENMEIDIEFIEGKAISIVWPKVAELKITSTPPGVKGQSDTTYKEAELENGLKILVPQFVSEGETIKLDVENLEYLERLTTKSLKNAPVPVEKEKEKK